MALPYLAGQAIGFIPSSAGTTATGTIAMSAAAAGGFSQSWLGMSFMLETALTLTEASMYVSAAAGTLNSGVSTDLQCDIFADANALPSGASLGTNNSFAPSGTIGAGQANVAPFFARFGFAGVSLAANTMYWAVFRNANSAPTTNFPTFRFGASGTMPTWAGGGSNSFGWIKKQTSTGTLASMATAANSCAGLRLGFSDGSYRGLPFSNIASSEVAYSANEWGVKFTTPANAILNVRGASFATTIIGTPTGFMRYRLYQGNGTTPLATATSGEAGTFNATSGYAPMRWDAGSAIALSPSTVYRLTVGNTAVDASNAAFRSVAMYTWDADANSVALMPFGATAQACSFNGTAWTDTGSYPNQIHPFQLLLDWNGEFGSSGGGSSGPTAFAF